MVIDYSERRQVSKNRPRKQAPGLYIFFALGVILLIYTVGFTSGWFIHKACNKNNVPPTTLPVSQTVVKQKKSGAAALPTDAQKTPAPAGTKPPDAPLTFYYTLPKGGTTAMGSGINPPHVEKPVTAKTAVAPPAKAVQSTTETQQQQKPPVKQSPDKITGHQAVIPDVISPDSASAAKKPAVDKAKYTVQVASYHLKKEADDLKETLDKNGLLANVIESKIAGKGTLYRVRLGNRLDLETANKIALKAGKGAIVITE